MENNQTEPTESKSEAGFYVDDFDVNEVMDISERLSDLDHESKSMLFFMSLTVFNELQNKFVKSYKDLLNSKRITKTPVSEDEIKLFTILNESHQNFINKSLEEEEEQEETENRETEPQPTQSSLLRMLWRRYRIEFFIKIMLIIFLLKLPYFCYFITTIVYILYCLGFFSLIARLSNTLRNSRNMQSVVRFFVNILETLEPLLMIQLNPGTNTQPQMPQNNPQTTNIQSTPDTQTQTLRNRTATSSQASQEQTAGGQSVSTLQRPTAGTPSTSETAGHTQDQVQSEFGQEAQQGSAQDQSSSLQRTEGREGGQQVTETRTREKPTYIEKFIYQVFFSFLLSLLPWWEPNPIYLEE